MPLLWVSILVIFALQPKFYKMSAEVRKKIAVNYGLVLGAITLLSGIVQYVLIDGYNLAVQNSGNTAFNIIGFIVLIVIPALAILKAKKEQGGFITFGEAFKLSFTAIIYSSLIGVVWVLLYTLVLEPGYQETAQEIAMEQMYEQSPNMTEEQAEQGITFMGYFTSPWILAGMTVLFSAIMGAIVSVIEAAIFQKKPAEFS